MWNVGVRRRELVGMVGLWLGCWRRYGGVGWGWGVGPVGCWWEGRERIHHIGHGSGYKQIFPRSQKWQDVTLQEMTRFLGIILMMSLRPLDSGGYAAYFQPSNTMYSLGTAIPSVEILDSAGWATRYMRLAWFRQIRGAFHPESKEAGRGGDKCFQLRKLIQAVNAASKRSFLIPQDLAFDEGGIGCRSRYCPVRQYNKDKPAKFRVDFFILASSTSYAILHMDVYQGKNATNSYIREEAKQLTTTMKAVVNACYALELNKETRGFRHLSLDNRYAAPQLMVILRDRLNVLATGTVRVNRVGWSKVLMDLKKTKTNRGTMKLGHDEEPMCQMWYCRAFSEL